MNGCDCNPPNGSQHPWTGAPERSTWARICYPRADGICFKSSAEKRGYHRLFGCRCRRTAETCLNVYSNTLRIVPLLHLDTRGIEIIPDTSGTKLSTVSQCSFEQPIPTALDFWSRLSAEQLSLSLYKAFIIELNTSLSKVSSRDSRQHATTSRRGL